MPYTASPLAPEPVGPVPWGGIDHNLIESSLAAVAESRPVIAEADRLLVLFVAYIRPLAYACATMSKDRP